MSMPHFLLRRVSLPMLLGLILFALPARGHHTTAHKPPLLDEVGLDQRLHEQIPLDLAFWDETGAPVRLGDYFGAKPVILTLAYYDCPNLCTLVLNGLLRTLRALSFTVGEQFNVVTVSIDPDNTPAMAAAKKEQYARGYGRPGAVQGWHFLAGEPAAIQRLAQAVGFRYTYDAEHDQFAHASGIMLLTPQGKLARYFYGVEYAPRDVRLGLIEAAANRIGSPIDQLLLFCYHYDPKSGTYSLVILNVLRMAGLATVLLLGAFIGVMFRRDRRPKSSHEKPEAGGEGGD
jgi:protein SCO1/2